MVLKNAKGGRAKSEKKTGTVTGGDMWIGKKKITESQISAAGTGKAEEEGTLNGEEDVLLFAFERGSKKK